MKVELVGAAPNRAPGFLRVRGLKIIRLGSQRAGAPATIPRMNAIRTARERARLELTREIKAAARAQIAADGAQNLSLRAVARELSMASSAVYRYFPSRDELLTALIIDAFNALGECAETADARTSQSAPTVRWHAVWVAVRDWAVTHPHEYALLYGSPVPNYVAPQASVAPAARVRRVLISVVREAEARGTLRPVRRQAAVRPSAAADLPPWAATRLVECWTQLLGLISCELFGHLEGVVDEPDAFFAHTARETGSWLE